MGDVMREIKFRAYYQKVTDNSWIIEGEYTFRDLTDKGIKFDQERIKWVEYTGLKDRNGVEICEDDIVTWQGYEVSNGRQIRPTRKWLVEWDYLKLCQIQNIIESNRTLEIIGNKFENPELLEGVK